MVMLKSGCGDDGVWELPWPAGSGLGEGSVTSQKDSCPVSMFDAGSISWRVASNMRRQRKKRFDCSEFTYLRPKLGGFVLGGGSMEAGEDAYLIFPPGAAPESTSLSLQPVEA